MTRVWQLLLHFFALHPILRARATKDRLERSSLFLSPTCSYVALSLRTLRRESSTISNRMTTRQFDANDI